MNSSERGKHSKVSVPISLQPNEFLFAIVSREVERDGSAPAIWAILPLLEMREELLKEVGIVVPDGIIHLDRLIALMACEVLSLANLGSEQSQTLLGLFRNLKGSSDGDPQLP